MVNKFVFLSLVIIVIGYSQKNDVSFSVTNPIALGRLAETVSIDLNGLVQQFPELKGKELTVLEKNKELVSQQIDNDQDGVNDELIFQASFKPNETKTFLLRTASNTNKQIPALVDCRYVLPRQDIAWENDRIAFRIYGSVLAGNVDNGTDVWTKRVRYPIVKKWYDGEEQTPKIVYHEDHGEGADFFSVGRSLGAGSAGILWKGKLIQYGLFTNYRIITNGPIRASFEVYYPGVMLDSSRTIVVKRITLDAGEQLNSVTERYITSVNEGPLSISVGLVKRQFVTPYHGKDNKVLSLWGLTVPDSVNGYLGTGIVLPQNNITALEDSTHCLLTASTNAQKMITYYSGAGWSRMGDITGERQWIAYLEQFLLRKQNPLAVSFH